MRPRAAAVALLLLPFAVSGCSIPTWVPLLGKSKAAMPAEVPSAPRFTSAPILTSRDQLHASDDVVAGSLLSDEHETDRGLDRVP